MEIGGEDYPMDQDSTRRIMATFSLESSKMDSNTARESSSTRMETFTVESSSMVCHRALENTRGATNLFTKEISNKATETGMEFGTAFQGHRKTTKAITCSIRSMDTEYTTGETDTSTRELSWTTCDPEKDNFSTMENSCTAGTGKMEKKPITVCGHTMTPVCTKAMATIMMGLGTILQQIISSQRNR